MPLRHIVKPRRIIDRKALMARLNAIATDPELKKFKVRGEVLALFKQVLADGHAEVRRRFFEDGATGTDVVRANAYLMDQIVRLIHDFCLDHVFQTGVRTKGEQLSVLAVGGYGRGELSPYSDIDLLFLLPYKTTPYSEQVVEYILYMLWDLGLKVGHSTRNVDECMRQARGDVTIRTALLESRWIWGDQHLAREFVQRFRKDVIEGTGIEFVEAKLAERDERHDKLGDSRYVLEPNLKEGKGGLRDLHTLFWIAQYLYGVSDMGELVDLGVLTPDAAQTFAKAQNFLWTVRCHLHYLTGRLEDRLTFDVQPDLAERMNYTDHAGASGVERFMRHYFLVAKDVGDLTRILLAVLEENHKRKPKFSLGAMLGKPREIDGFVVEGGRVGLAEPDTFKTDPAAMIRLFHVAHQHDLDIHPNALRAVTTDLKRIRGQRANAEANRLFLDILCSRKNPEGTLRWLNESGVFGRFIPDFARVVAQMQYDMYHVYTTDEHTIRAMGILHRIESGQLAEDVPVASEVIHKVHSRRALYVALFLHDIAKGRGGDHSELGAKVAKRLCPRLGLSEEETETVAWLVRHHLLMSNTAFRRDIDDPKTVADFTEIVQSPERLRLLLVLTVADIRAVGPNIWNGWKAGLLRSLYHAAEEMLLGSPAAGRVDQRVESAKDAARAALAGEIAEGALETLFNLGYPTYWLGFDAETHARHLRMIHAAETKGDRLTFDCRSDPRHDATEVVLYTADHPGLFSRIAGGLALGGATILDAKIYTMANGMALDTFWIQTTNGEAIESPAKMKALRTSVEKALMGTIHLPRELEAKAPTLPSRTRVFTVPPRVIVDNTASTTHTVIEINGRDRVGLLHDITAGLTRLHLQISSAHIATYGERAVDVFYVKDVYGMKVEHEAKLKQIRDELLDVLGGEPDENAMEVRQTRVGRSLRELSRTTPSGKKVSAS